MTITGGREQEATAWEGDDGLDVHRRYRRTRVPRLRAAIAQANTGLVRQLAARFANRGEGYDDLVQVARAVG
jgi:DNA-directed RNA polymerase specialized sigma subunit